MKTVLKIKPKGIPLKLISSFYNDLKLKLPRKLRFSGNFHLYTLRFTLKILGVNTSN